MRENSLKNTNYSFNTGRKTKIRKISLITGQVIKGAGRMPWH